MKQIMSLFVLALLSTSLVAAGIGSAPDDYEAPSKFSKLLEASATGGLQPMETHTGKISWSIDASGSNAGSDTIQVDKPAGATVRAAYLMATSTGFSRYQITDTDVTLAGTPVVWEVEIANDISSYNYWSDVTAIVKPIIDGAASGINDLVITEVTAGLIDGETLVVIFDDASQPDSTIILAFGAQQIAGDTFNIGLADPIDKNKPGFALDMSLGISFSYQNFAGQYSTIDINGNRLTSSAGGNDDGEYQNGALITTGGIGDSVGNPADPNETPGGSDDTRYDDELYDLTSFVNDGDTSIDATTQNPSADDNIYFAGFYLGATTAVVGEGILLSPQSASNPLYTQHTVTATVQNTQGDPVVGTLVSFEIISGPNTGLTGSVLTDALGKADFTWSSNAVGLDEVIATFVSSTQEVVESNQVTKTWYVADEIPEFGMIGALVVIVGALGLVAFRRN